MQEINKVAANVARGSEWAREVAGMSAGEILAEYARQPVCPRCEGMACRDHGWKDGGRAACISCGWRGITVTMDEYITKKLYK